MKTQQTTDHVTQLHRLKKTVAAFPVFQPHSLLRGPNVQTIGATYLSLSPKLPPSTQHVIDLNDGDRLAIQDNQPPNWRSTDPVAMLIHGLSGCHGSTYMVRTTAKLISQGVRTFRLDMRGCGAGWSLAKNSMHAGRGDDVQAGIEFIAKLCPEAPRAAVGFSLGGATLLRAISTHNTKTDYSLSCAMAICPPIDLEVCSATLCLPRNRVYDRKMSQWLYRYVIQRRETNRDVAKRDTGKCPKSILAFDEQFTAPLGGFDSASQYYRQCSVRPLLSDVRVPTLILAAQDDPLIPFTIFENAPYSDSTQLCTSRRGGHIGFLGRSKTDADRWWLDWRIVDWVLAGCNRPPDA